MSTQKPVDSGIAAIEQDEQPTASVNTTKGGDVLGVTLFLGKGDLEDLGVSDAGTVAYSVENGALRVAGVSSE